VPLKKRKRRKTLLATMLQEAAQRQDKKAPLFTPTQANIISETFSQQNMTQMDILAETACNTETLQTHYFGSAHSESRKRSFEGEKIDDCHKCQKILSALQVELSDVILQLETLKNAFKNVQQFPSQINSPPKLLIEPPRSASLPMVPIIALDRRNSLPFDVMMRNIISSNQDSPLLISSNASPHKSGFNPSAPPSPIDEFHNLKKISNISSLSNTSSL